MENKQITNNSLRLYISYQEKIKCCQSLCQLTDEPFFFIKLRILKYFRCVRKVEVLAFTLEIYVKFASGSLWHLSLRDQDLLKGQVN